MTGWFARCFQPNADAVRAEGVAREDSARGQSSLQQLKAGQPVAEKSTSHSIATPQLNSAGQAPAKPTTAEAHAACSRLVAVDASTAAPVRAEMRRERHQQQRTSSEDEDVGNYYSQVSALPLHQLLKRFSLDEAAVPCRAPPQAPGVIGFLELASSVSGLAWLGSGANGVVYSASWHGSRVALKLMVVAQNSHTSVQRSCSEAVLTRQLSHPSVVQCFAVGFGLITDQCWEELNALGGSNACPEQTVTTAATNVDMTSLQSLDEAALLEQQRAEEAFGDGRGFSSCGAADPRSGVSLYRALKELRVEPNHHYCTAVLMEYMDGGTLHQAIESGNFSAERAPEQRTKLLALLLTALELAQGMAHLHGMDVLHGDLKPTNVLLRTACAPTVSDPRGFSAKIADLGLARPCNGSDPSAITSDQWGALAYLAPEAARGCCSKASDVYSFGVMLWELGAGMRPYLDLSTPQVLMGLMTGSLQLNWPDDSCVYVPLKRLALACIERNPTERPSFDMAARLLARMVGHVRQALLPLRQRHSSALSMQLAAHTGGCNSPGTSGRNSPGYPQHTAAHRSATGPSLQQQLALRASGLALQSPMTPMSPMGGSCRPAGCGGVRGATSSVEPRRSMTGSSFALEGGPCAGISERSLCSHLHHAHAGGCGGLPAGVDLGGATISEGGGGVGGGCNSLGLRTGADRMPSDESMHGKKELLHMLCTSAAGNL